MLAQLFKTAEDLGLSDQEHTALIQLLGMLERGELKHHAVPTEGKCVFDFDRWERTNHKYSGLFNMGTYYSTGSCGTVACLAGTSDLLFKTNFVAAKHTKVSLQLDDLFHLHAFHDIPDVSTEQAATALRNYLTTGDAHWQEVLNPSV